MDKFYVQNIILPTGILLALSSLIFFLPSELSDRIGYGITVTLALCVNLVIVIDFIPETSRTIPSLCTYFLVCICLSGFSILLSTVSLNIASSKSQTENSTDSEAVVHEHGVNGKPRKVDKQVSKLGKFFEKQFNLKIQEPTKLFDRVAGVIYLLITTAYTVYFLWK